MKLVLKVIKLILKSSKYTDLHFQVIIILSMKMCPFMQNQSIVICFQSPDYNGRRRHRRSLVSVAESDEDDIVAIEGALEFEGEFELGLGPFNHHPSPARSDATEASDWRPGDLSAVEELPAVEEEEAEEVRNNRNS